MVMESIADTLHMTPQQLREMALEAKTIMVESQLNDNTSWQFKITREEALWMADAWANDKIEIRALMSLVSGTLYIG